MNFKRFSILLIMLWLLIATVGIRAENSSPATEATGSYLLEAYHPSGISLAKKYLAGTRIALPREFHQYGNPILELDEWGFLQSISNSLSIPPGDHYAIRIDAASRHLQEITPPINFSPLCREAIERVPHWLRYDFIDNLRLFGNMDYLRDIFAELLLNTQDPYVDEMAFVMAHLSPSMLTGGAMNTDFELLVENIQDVYAADEYLEYVQINDYGSSLDDDYWSTVEYSIRTAEGDTVQIEIDRELYYWYIVHPRITDEVPRYIDPTNGRAIQPPDGRFWRNFFLNEPDDGYQSLREILEGCEIMYGNLWNDNGEGNGAVGAVTRWIREVMVFDSGAERPIQPVRIYALHMGRCGEHQDITAAAARAALIPCLGTTSITEDHVWDEFWDGTRWKTWEPVNNYIGDSLAYQRWGKHFPALFDWRPDGWIWTVTDRYHSNTTTLDIQILDTHDNPVDGARVKMLSDYLYGGLQIATCGWTDSEGRVSFTIGGGRDIYLNISSPLGNYPIDPNGGVLVIEDSDTDLEYVWIYNYNNQIQLVTPEEAPDPVDPLNRYHLTINYEMLNEATHGQVFSQADFVAEVGQGSLDFFICDAENYTQFEADEEFTAYSILEMTDTGVIDFTIPDEGTWFVVVNNDNSLTNFQRVSLSTDFYMFYTDELVHFEPVDPTGMPFAIVVDEATLDGDLLLPGDEIAIYDMEPMHGLEELCVGAVVVDGDYPLVMIAWQMDMPADIPGYIPENEMFFRIWSAEEDGEYAATADFIIGDGLFHHINDVPFNEITLESYRTYTMTLPLRGNYFELISFYVQPPDLDGQEVFRDVPHLEIVYRDDGSVLVPPLLTFDIDLREGYQVFCSGQSELTTGGLPVDAGMEFELSARCWNWLGYPFRHPLPVEQALSEIGDEVEILMNDEGRLWLPGFLNTLGNLQPGEGYMVYVSQDVTFHYNNEPRRVVATGESFTALPKVSGAPRATGLPYLVLVTLSDDLQAMNPSTIEVYDGAALVGKALIEEASGSIPVIAWQGSPEHNLDGFTPGNSIQVTLQHSDGVSIPLEQMNEARFGEGAYASIMLEAGALVKQFTVRPGYPNPFNPMVTIPFELPSSGEVTVTVFNLLGQLVYTSTNTFQAGLHSFTFDANQAAMELVSGVYFVQVAYNGQSQVQKLMLLK